MFKLVIQDDEGKTTVVPLIRDEITIGRKEGNTIRLTERNVSRRHARILRNNGEVHIEDLGSYNGIRVNNARIAERVSLRVSDQVQIGDYKLYLKAEGLEQQVDESMTSPVERVEQAAVTPIAPIAAAVAPAEPMPAATPAPTAPHPVQAIHQSPQIVGSPNRTMVAMPDDANGRSIGPATQEALDALKRTTGYGKLVVLSSNFAGKEFELSRPQMIIGRTDENDIVVNHRSISRNHAKLVREPETGRYTISDLQSSNGVRVNGQDYGKVELRRGDVVDLGHVRLRFVEAGEDFVFARDAVITDVPEAGGKRGMVMAIIAAILVLAAGFVVYEMHSSSDKNGNQGSNNPQGGSNLAMADTDAGLGSGSADPSMVKAGSDTTDPGPGPGVKPPEANTPKVAACIELKVQKKWQDLHDCAKGLDDKAKADELLATAKAETTNEKSDFGIRQQIHNGALKDAQAELKKMSPDSVYFKSLSDAFDKADLPNVDVAKAKVNAYVAEHNCAALKHYASQQSGATGTDRVVAVVNNAVARCTEKVEPKPHPGPGSNVAVNPGPGTNPTTAPAATKFCETANIDDLMQQASNQFNSGYASSALLVMTKALGCKQEVRMYRLAALYACAAHDQASAKLYFGKVPSQFQSGILQKCQLEHVDLGVSPP